MVLSAQKRKLLNQFKEYAVSHPHLLKVDQALTAAINEPAGFAHVLVYGPSGVGKTTMINQITKRLNGISSKKKTAKRTNKEQLPPMPLLLVETRPPDGNTFNRTDYYRTALKILGESFYERRLLVDVDTEQAWEKKGRSRSKSSQFNDSPELRNALESALVEREVKAVILDEAQHLMKIGTGRGAGQLLDQLDWIKSLTNVTGVLHILIGTYELLNFQNLSGQASRRGLEIHFPRYLFQNEQDRLAFQGILLALLKQVPLKVDIPLLMEQWLFFYERSIGCIGVLKDWLIRTVAVTLNDGDDTLSVEKLSQQALKVGQCERMAIDAIEGEQKLGYMAARQEQLWRLLEIQPTPSSITGEIAVENQPTSNDEDSTSSSDKPIKTTRKRRSNSSKSKVSQSAKSSKKTEKPEDSATSKTTATTSKKTSSRASSKKTTNTQTPESGSTSATPSSSEQTSSKPTSVETQKEKSPSKKQTSRKKIKSKNTEDTTSTDKLASTQDSLEQEVVDGNGTNPSSISSTPPKKRSRVGQRKPKRDNVGE